MSYLKLFNSSTNIGGRFISKLKVKLNSNNYPKYGKTALFGLLGMLIGGPIGLVIIHICHTPIVVSVIIESTSIIFGASTTHFVRKTYHQVHLAKLSTVDARKLCLCFSQARVEESFQLFLQLLSHNKALQTWYENLLAKYYKTNKIVEKVNGTDLAKQIGHIRNTLNQMVLELVNFILDDTYEVKQLDKIIDVNDIEVKEASKIVLIYTISERVLMISLYQDLYKISRLMSLSQDRLYKIKRKRYQQEIETDPNIIKKFNSLPLKITALQKISILLDICNLIANQEFIGCDCLLIAFVNNLVKSDILNPFTEILIMESFLPGRLLGKEAYVLSTFSASAQFIINI